MRPYGILEMVQTGLVALERGDAAMDVSKSRYSGLKAVVNLQLFSNMSVLKIK
ncbi:MAG: hypothetical protein ACLR2G_07940 [Phascolarctobacterium faecium]